MGHHTCTFVEEAEPSGRLIIGPCLECGLSAFDALKVVREIGSDRFAGIVAMRDKLATSEQTVERLERRVKELEKRLEIDVVFDIDGNEKPAPPNIPDGIECRDITIKLQDEEIADLQAQLAAEQEELRKVKATCDMLGRERNAADEEVYSHQQAVERLERQLAEAKAGRQFGACPQCLTCAWEICKSDTPDAVEMKCSNGSTWWRCGYCLGKQQVAQLREEVTKAGKDYEACRDSLDRTVLAHTTLRGLVEALPVRAGDIAVKETDVDLMKVYGVTEDGYFTGDTPLFDTKEEAEAYAALLTYRATLPREGGAQEVENG